jgi:hypothetical protein
MSGMSSPIPLRLDPSAIRERNVVSFVRACIATGLAALDKSRPSEHAKRWADDRNMDLVLRASVTPTALANTPALAAVSVAYLDILTPQSAGADLLRRGVALNFAGSAQINVPAIAVPTGGFVAEGQPIPVVTEPTSPGPTLTPHKLALMTTVTDEMLRNPNAETLIRQALIESCGPAIDKVLFSNSAATAAAPAGLLAGISGLTPASSAAGKDQIIVDDLQALSLAIAPVAGNGNVVVVASPDAAVALRLRVLREDVPILVSASLAPKTVIMVATNAVASAMEGAPQVDASPHTSLHRETNPQPIVNDSGTVAIPVGSVFQTGQVGIRLRWPISWALRDPRGLSWMSSVNW